MPFRALVAAAVLAAIAGCSPPRAGEGAGVRIETIVTPRPPVEGTAQVEVRLRDAADRPLGATAVELVGNMSHPGMRPSVASARRIEPGRWRADLELTMGGDWFVEVEARLEDGRVIRRTVELPGVRPR